MTSMASTIPAYLLPGVHVCQPSHLEGDPSLATEILPGPPSIVAAQNSLQKRDPRKDPGLHSYLPSSDPGTTYSGIMHGTWIGQDSRTSKRAKLDKGGASGRAQRASARNQNGATSAADSLPNSEGASGSQAPLSLSVDSDIMILDDDLSPASSQNVPGQSSQGVSTRGKMKDKGKGKEVEIPLRIKEEPQPASLPPEPQVDLLNNNDHCSACRSQGALVYCDGCPRAFHLWCLDPPMESIDEGDSRWFCPACTISKPPPGLLAPLIQSLDNSIPIEYQLPDDIRTFFKDVGTSSRGGYVDTAIIKPPRLNRHGQLEDRDAHRLRDRNGQPVLCFRCGTSALPESAAAATPAMKRARKTTAKAAQYEMWKNIISCDYCNLHWHLDCLDPPLSTMPSFSKKWMCPNHAEQIITPKHRIPKTNPAPIEITKPGHYNNGNVEIVETQPIRPITMQPKVTVDEVLINGRRYRVPERVILLDFWNKIRSGTAGVVQDGDSRSSSPLTSLSSLDDEDLHAPPPPTASSTKTDLEVAQMLWDFKRGINLNGHSSAVNGSLSRLQSENAVTVDPTPSSQSTPKPSKAAKPTPAEKRAATKAAAGASASSSTPMVPPIEAISIVPSTATTRRRRTNTNNSQPESSTRELRSRSKAADRSRRSGDEPDNASIPLAASLPKLTRVEESDLNPLLLGGAAEPFNDPVLIPVSPVKPPPKRRPHRKKVTNDDASSITVKQENDPPAPPPLKRGKKRKERDDEGPYIDSSERNNKAREKKAAKTRTTSARSVPSSTSVSSSALSSVSTPGASASTPATPSLKIRLPRMNATGSPMKPTVPASSARS
ncbi:hypothetical protein BDP27DRAFT_622160 [Rhodocollybia butyracea]|uniref:PHD-type domain-containing protein n=1 Tax=Rhodocollybia butyracea TaxID=206335 RepID=A0A9P5PW29_9AGAR|nr:hypothetical protein BDP27DRAFT_622160 [Rhodocollybia butyracea]